VIGQFITAYFTALFMLYDFVCLMGFIIHHFFHRFHGHLRNIFCTHLITQAPYDAFSEIHLYSARLYPIYVIN